MRAAVLAPLIGLVHAVLVCVPVLAAPLSDAARLIASGDFQEAATLLEKAADDDPNGRSSAEALAKAAQLYEEKLDDPARAATLYRRLLSGHPSSRPARRARVRLKKLEVALGSSGQHAAALAKYTALLRRAHTLPELRGVEAMKSLLMEHPDLPVAGEARVWIGNALMRSGQYREAHYWFLQASRDDDALVVWRATKSAGDALLRISDFDGARGHYMALTPAGQLGRKRAKEAAIARVDRLETRASRARWAWLMVLLFVAVCIARLRRACGSWRGTIRHLSKPPAEVLFLTPPSLFIAGLALTGNELVAIAVSWSLGGALLLTWISGSTLAALSRNESLGWGARLVHASFVGLAVVALLYTTLAEQQLLDFLAHTAEFGHD